jgi:hypothetical protein
MPYGQNIHIRFLHVESAPGAPAVPHVNFFIRLDNRCRDSDGSIRRNRGGILVGTLREEYGEDFAPDARSDLRLDTLLYQEGYELAH